METKTDNKKNKELISGLSALLGLPQHVFNTLINKTELCIGSMIQDAKTAGKETTEIDIGIGKLCIKLATRQCKFIPSKDLTTAIKMATSTPVDPIELALEQELSARLIAACESTF